MIEVFTHDNLVGVGLSCDECHHMYQRGAKYTRPALHLGDRILAIAPVIQGEAFKDGWAPVRTSEETAFVCPECLAKTPKEANR